MRQVVLAHQNLLNPPPPKVPYKPEVLTLALAHELLSINAEQGLKNLFCAAVHALNDWRGQWSPLPVVPERCSTEEILDLLEKHPHWFVSSGATAECVISDRDILAHRSHNDRAVLRRSAHQGREAEL